MVSIAAFEIPKYRVPEIEVPDIDTHAPVTSNVPGAPSTGDGMDVASTGNTSGAVPSYALPKPANFNTNFPGFSREDVLARLAGKDKFDILMVGRLAQLDSTTIPRPGPTKAVTDANLEAWGKDVLGKAFDTPEMRAQGIQVVGFVGDKMAILSQNGPETVDFMFNCGDPNVDNSGFTFTRTPGIDSNMLQKLAANGTPPALLAAASAYGGTAGGVDMASLDSGLPADWSSSTNTDSAERAFDENGEEIPRPSRLDEERRVRAQLLANQRA